MISLILQQLQAHCLCHSSVNTDPEHDAVKQDNQELQRCLERLHAAGETSFTEGIIKYTDGYIKE